ncbi:MAG: hypothetical protein K2J57_02540, partial [Bacteroidales bacterium]|nr:hypothetical protein [Bacteroidales bacterium]
YRAVVHDDATPQVWDTVKDEDVVTLQVFSGKSPFALTIRDGSDDDMQDGDVRDQHQVVFIVNDTVSGTGNDAYKQYFNRLCVMRRITKDSAAVVEGTCQEAPAGGFTFPVTIPSFNANVEEHDSTLYFVMAYNHCGKVASDTNLLRVYDTLIVRWIADRIVYTEAGDQWSVDSLDEIVPGMLVDVYSKFDSMPLQAHLFLCDSTYAIFSDTTLKGFMNPVDMIEDNRNSKWWMRESEDDEWYLADPFEWDNGNNTEHDGYFGVPHGEVFTLENNGMQIKGWGLNNLYCDSTSVLTVHVLPRLEEGDLAMTPAEISLCESAPGNDQTFTVTSKRYEGELWEQAAEAYNLQWQYRTPEGDAWVDVDTNAGRTLWHFGAVKAEHNGWRIRAVASALCGSDTVEAVIRVTPSAVPEVHLVSDSACLGNEFVFTATTENMGDNPVFEWFVDDVKDGTATGAEFRTSALPAGPHNITVRATLTAGSTLCVSPDNASDTQVAVVYNLPQIEAFIADTIMKNIDTTSVWVKGQGNYTYVWTPETGLLDATADSTLLWGLEAREKPHVYVVTATDENGCQAQDSVQVIIESNFTIDSVGIVTVVPPVLDLDGGTLPGYPDEPGDSYYPEIGGTPFGGELMFRNDTVAELWICAHNTALIRFYVRGGELPISYTWTIDEGNATLVYETDSVFGIFFPDTTTHTMKCEIKDKTGVGGTVTVNVHYYKPEMFYLEVTPKVTSGKYYEQQAMNFFVRPDRDWLTTWVVVRNGEVDTVTNRNMNRQMSFTKEEGDETSIWISTVDRHGCRIWDSVPIHIIPLPNVLLIGDPINGVIFPEFEVEVTNSWGLKVKTFEDRNGNGTSLGWDGRTKSGSYVVAGTYYYRAKIPTLDKKGYMIVNGAVTVVNK